jgi:hypothetical protein
MIGFRQVPCPAAALARGAAAAGPRRQSDGAGLVDLGAAAGVTAGENALRPLLELHPLERVRPLLPGVQFAGVRRGGGLAARAALVHRLRFVVFLKMLGVVAGGSAWPISSRADWDSPAEAIGFLVFLGICVLIAVTGLASPDGLCRGRYRPVTLALWLAVAVAALVAAGSLSLCPAGGRNGQQR